MKLDKLLSGAPPGAESKDLGAPTNLHPRVFSEEFPRPAGPDNEHRERRIKSVITRSQPMLTRPVFWFLTVVCVAIGSAGIVQMFASQFERPPNYAHFAMGLVILPFWFIAYEFFIAARQEKSKPPEEPREPK